MTKKIGIFGGTFDPVHSGHMELARQAANELGLDKLILVPARLQPFKLDKKTASGSDRVEMLRLAVKEWHVEDRFEVSDVELKRDGISYTIDTLRAFQALYPEAEIYFIIGTDAFLMMDKWKSAEEICANYFVAVGMRPGCEENGLSECIDRMKGVYNTKGIIRLHNAQVDISSTELRDGTGPAADLPDSLIPDSVERYIKEHGLYK